MSRLLALSTLLLWGGSEAQATWATAMVSRARSCLETKNRIRDDMERTRKEIETHAKEEEKKKKEAQSLNGGAKTKAETDAQTARGKKEAQKEQLKELVAKFTENQLCQDAVDKKVEELVPKYEKELAEYVRKHPDGPKHHKLMNDLKTKEKRIEFAKDAYTQPETRKTVERAMELNKDRAKILEGEKLRYLNETIPLDKTAKENFERWRQEGLERGYGEYGAKEYAADKTKEWAQSAADKYFSDPEIQDKVIGNVARDQIQRELHPSAIRDASTQVGIAIKTMGEKVNQGFSALDKQIRDGAAKRWNDPATGLRQEGWQDTRTTVSQRMEAAKKQQLELQDPGGLIRSRIYWRRAPGVADSIIRDNRPDVTRISWYGADDAMSGRLPRDLGNKTFNLPEKIISPKTGRWIPNPNLSQQSAYNAGWYGALDKMYQKTYGGRRAVQAQPSARSQVIELSRFRRSQLLGP